MIDFEAIDRGFSRKAAEYDAYGARHPAIQWTRRQVRDQVLRLAPPDAHLLELNAGTGDDALFLVQHGLRVHALDLAAGMVAAMRTKIAEHHCENRWQAEQGSFTNLAHLPAHAYDLVFSNFGGLNCIPDLHPVAAALPRLLKPTGYVVCVVMPPICPWELAQIFRGRWRVAWRRVRGQTRAQLAGAEFMTYYFTPQAVQRAFGPAFERVGLQSLSLFSPPAFMDGFPHHWPRLFHWLTRLDARFTAHAPFNQMGDFVISIFRYRG